MAHRVERLNSQIRQEISVLIQQQAKDPRLDAFISVTEVITSPDLKYARIYISCISGQEEKDKYLNVLNAASGFFRTELAKKIRMRRIPELSFHWDDSIERGDRILRLLDQVHSEEE
jgi:ribosome-binding factor A